MFRAMFSAVRGAVRRPAFWFLVWTYRDVFRLWGRSIGAELSSAAGSARGFDADRLGRLAKALWSTTVDTRFVVPTRLRLIDVGEATSVDAVVDAKFVVRLEADDLADDEVADRTMTG